MASSSHVALRCARTGRSWKSGSRRVRAGSGIARLAESTVAAIWLLLGRVGCLAANSRARVSCVVAAVAHSSAVVCFAGEDGMKSSLLLRRLCFAKSTTAAGSFRTREWSKPELCLGWWTGGVEDEGEGRTEFLISRSALLWAGERKKMAGSWVVCVCCKDRGAAVFALLMYCKRVASDDERFPDSGGDSA